MGNSFWTSFARAVSKTSTAASIDYFCRPHYAFMTAVFRVANGSEGPAALSAVGLPETALVAQTG
jgi:hypothetical protein